MKRLKKSIILKLFILIIGLLLVVTITGCIDPVASECQENHLRLGEIAKQQLRYGPSSYSLNPQQGAIYRPVQ